MRKSLLVLIACFLCIVSFAQTTFTSLIKTPKKTFGTSVITATNEDYYIPFTNNDSGLYISRVSNNGKIIWQKKYGTATGSGSAIIRATKDDGFLIFCNLFNQRLNKTLPYLVKCNKSGNIIWSKSIQLNSKSYLYPESILIDENGYYILLYDIGFYNDETDHLGIAKFDSSGKVSSQISIKNIYTNFYQGFNVNSFSQTQKGGYIIGLSYAVAFVEGSPTGYLLLIDSIGKKISYKSTRPYSNSFDDFDSPLKTWQQENKYKVLGSFSKYNGDGTRTGYYYFVEIDKNTQSTKAKLIPSNSFALQRYLREQNLSLTIFFHDIVSKKNIVSLEFAGSGNIYDSMELKKFDSAGRICPDYTLPSYSYDTASITFLVGDEIEGISMATDSIVATSEVVKAKDVHSFNKICSGEVPSLTQTNLSQKALSIIWASIFPNPAHNTITVSIPVSKNKQTQLNLFNSYGKLLQSFPVYNYQTTINIASYTKGLYIIKIAGAEETQILKFIKQ